VTLCINLTQVIGLLFVKFNKNIRSNYVHNGNAKKCDDKKY